MGINDLINIGARIKKLRKEKGIKQKEMAEKINIPSTTYSNYENGHREPPPDVVISVAEVLGVEVEELLGLNDLKRTLEKTINTMDIKIKRDKEFLDSQIIWSMKKKLETLGFNLLFVEIEGDSEYVQAIIETQNRVFNVTPDELSYIDRVTNDFLLFQLKQIKKGKEEIMINESSEIVDCLD